MESVTQAAEALASGASDVVQSSSVSSMSTEDHAVAARSSGSWFGLFGWIILIILQLITSLLYWAIRLVTIRLPTVLFSLLSSKWTVTMNATTLMLALAAVVSVATLIVRYRILNMYSRLPPEPQRKEPDVDLFPDTQEGGVKSGLSSYLDEFISAIKIFGYLERPVFHELTRSMQTRKLIAGETFNLEDEKGFCIVVDGLVEIFVKSGGNRPGYDATNSASPMDEEETSARAQQRYQLLTEVRNGASMSSLFSIMSLFTEDITLRPTEDENPISHENANGHSSYPRHERGHSDSPLSLPSTPQLRVSMPRSHPKHDVTSAPRDHHTSSSKIPPMSLDSAADSPTTQRPRPFDRRASHSAHPDILARATVDTTIAIIPASAFRRLIKVYPKATAHIVHVILTRFQRVTLAQAYTYLGLTGEVLQTEKNMIPYTTCQLPNILRGDALSRLKEKFKKERERLRVDDEAKGIALHNAAAGRRRAPSTHLRREAMMQSMSKHATVSLVANPDGISRENSNRQNLSPGDLIGDVQFPRRPHRRSPSGLGDSMSNLQDGLRKDNMTPLEQRAFNPLASQKHTRIWSSPSETLDEDNLFRVSVLESTFRALGLEDSSVSRGELDSAEGSPHLLSYDQKRQKAIFTTNAFGIMGPLDGSADGETESVNSGGTAINTLPNANTLASDMKDEVEIVFFPKGSVLIEQGERSPGLYYVIDGFLDIGVSSPDSSADMIQPGTRSSAKADARTSYDGSDMPTARFSSLDGSRTTADDQDRAQKSSRRSVALVKPGGLAGYVSTVSSYRSFIDVVARTDVYVGFLPRASLEKIVDRYPIILLTMAKRLTNILPRLILHIDFALEWVQVNAGQVIFHDQDESDAIYIVLNGRLRLVEDKKDRGVAVKGEFGQGESVGELEVLTESARSGTLHAIRDTELVKFPRTLFNSLAQEHPNITIKIAKIIASRMRSLVDDPSKLIGKDAGGTEIVNKGSSTFNLRTVAVLPVTAGVPIVEFGNRLMNAMSQVGPPNGATMLNQAAILNHLGKHAFNKIGKLKLSQYLADLEEKYGLVLYVADTNVNSPWTQTCITQADCILLVGLAAGSTEIGEYERFMLGMKSTARKTLVLVHADRYSSPGIARSWLRNRMWINGGHYHVQMPFIANDMPVHATKRSGTGLRERVQLLQAELFKYTSSKARQNAFYTADRPIKSDFHRLARRLCGKSIGLVLGGGGARGISQIGIIRAMEEEGIPIDLVGGTSIGALIGALYARHADVVPIYGLAKKFAGRMASMWRFALDLTYPSASYTTGHEFNRGLFKAFEDTQIEDFWLEYYCNTTNISKSRQEVHTSGYAWRYIRASMSLAGLLPPLCDEGSMLLDGGYIDNLTVSHMKRLGADIIFAVDVGAVDDDTPQTFGDSLSGFWAFFNRWNPLSSHPNPPTLAEIQGRLAYVSSVDALERAKTMAGCVYMRPPIDDFGTLDFGKFDEIYSTGYEFGKKFLHKLREQGVLPSAEETEAKKALRRTMGPRRASI